MFNALISQPLGRLIGRQPAAATVAVRTPTAPRPVAPPRGVALDMVVRRPLVSVGGALAGYEFCVDLPPSLYAPGTPDDPRGQLRATAVLKAMHACITAHGSLLALAELPASWVARCLGEGLYTRGMYLVLREDAMYRDMPALNALIARLRDAGVLLGWRMPEHRSDPLPEGRPDFLPLAAHNRASLDDWRQTLALGRHRWPDVPQVLLDQPDVELMEGLLAPPVALATCTVGVCDTPAQRQPLAASSERLLQLLGTLTSHEDGARLAPRLKADAQTCQQLLAGLNASHGLPGRGLTTIEHALGLLGREALYRECARLLTRLAPPRPSLGLLQAQCLARARLIERLAHSAGEPNPGVFFALGFASVLPLLLQCDADDALALLRLPPAGINALGEHSGPWMRYLTLMRALERHDLLAAEALAQPFGGLGTVLPLLQPCWQNG